MRERILTRLVVGLALLPNLYFAVRGEPFNALMSVALLGMIYVCERNWQR